MISADTDLIKGCQAFQLKSQEALFKKYGSSLKQLCIRYARNKEDGKDIFQESFIKIFRDIRQLKKESELLSWMKRICINTCISHYRKKHIKTVSFTEECTDAESPETYTEYAENTGYEQALSFLSYEEILQLIHTLDYPQNIIFNLFYIEDFSHRDISTFLCISEPSCRVHLLRARKKLMKQIMESSDTSIHAR